MFGTCPILYCRTVDNDINKYLIFRFKDYNVIIVMSSHLTPRESSLKIKLSSILNHYVKKCTSRAVVLTGGKYRPLSASFSTTTIPIVRVELQQAVLTEDWSVTVPLVDQVVRLVATG